MAQKRKCKPAREPGTPGRKGKYQEWLTEDGLAILAGWARNGLTKEEIAHNCGCSLSTLKDWCKKYPLISAAITRAREEADIIVENALFKSTQGYTVRLSKTYKLKRVEFDKETGRKVLEQEYLQEGFEETHVPANERAQEFWLKNRKPDVWKDKPPEAERDSENTVEVLFDVDEEEQPDGEDTDHTAASE